MGWTWEADEKLELVMRVGEDEGARRVEAELAKANVHLVVELTGWPVTDELVAETKTMLAQAALTAALGKE